MSPVAQLRPSRTLQLAAVSGEPRPLVPSALRSPEGEPASVIQLHPVTPALREDPPSSDADEAMAETVQRISGIARSVTQGALEVLAGVRPLQQMARWLDPENYERLQLRTNLVRCIDAASGSGRDALPTTAHRHVVIRSARVCPVTTGVFEASVVAFDQKRVRAVALRIEQRRGVWRVTALEIG